MVLAENLMAYVCGMVVGIPFGTWLAARFVQMYESESFNMQAVIYPRSYCFAVVGILLTVLVAQLPGIRYIRRIELARATKDVG